MRRSVELLFLCVIALATAQSVQAQTQQGAGVIMGNLSFSTSSGDLYGDTRTQFQVGPRAYYFVANHVGLGGRLTFNSTSEGSRSSSQLFIGPDAAFFFGGGVVLPTVIPTVGVGAFFTTAATDNGVRSDSESGFTLALHGGMAVMLGPYLALLPELEFDLENRGGEAGSTIMISMGLAGFLY